MIASSENFSFTVAITAVMNLGMVITPCVTLVIPCSISKCVSFVFQTNFIIYYVLYLSYTGSYVVQKFFKAFYIYMYLCYVSSDENDSFFLTVILSVDSWSLYLSSDDQVHDNMLVEY